MKRVVLVMVLVVIAAGAWAENDAAAGWLGVSDDYKMFMLLGVQSEMVTMIQGLKEVRDQYASGDVARGIDRASALWAVNEVRQSLIAAIVDDATKMPADPDKLIPMIDAFYRKPENGNLPLGMAVRWAVYEMNGGTP